MEIRSSDDQSSISDTQTVIFQSKDQQKSHMSTVSLSTELILNDRNIDSNVIQFYQDSSGELVCWIL